MCILTRPLILVGQWCTKTQTVAVEGLCLLNNRDLSIWKISLIICIWHCSECEMGSSQHKSADKCWADKCWDKLVRGTMPYAFSGTNLNSKYSTKNKFYKHIYHRVWDGFIPALVSTIVTSLRSVRKNIPSACKLKCLFEWFIVGTSQIMITNFV